MEAVKKQETGGDDEEDEEGQREERLLGQVNAEEGMRAVVGNQGRGVLDSSTLREDK